MSFSRFHVCSVHMHAHLFIFFIFLSPSFVARRATQLFAEVLEKTVEGEAAALTKAKTLYKSCIGERKWA